MHQSPGTLKCQSQRIRIPLLLTRPSFLYNSLTLSLSLILTSRPISLPKVSWPKHTHTHIHELETSAGPFRDLLPVRLRPVINGSGGRSRKGDDDFDSTVNPVSLGRGFESAGGAGLKWNGCSSPAVRRQLAAKPWISVDGKKIVGSEILTVGCRKSGW
ncbi:hypothetical protein OROGR_008150 [Orobanche gracilis]